MPKTDEATKTVESKAGRMLAGKVVPDVSRMRELCTSARKGRAVSAASRNTGKSLVFLANAFNLPTLTSALLYKACGNYKTLFQLAQDERQDQGILRARAQCDEIQIWCDLAVYAILLNIKRQLGLKRAFTPHSPFRRDYNLTTVYT